MRHSPWMHVLNTCAAFCFVSCTEWEKSAPSCPLILPTNLLFLSLSLGWNTVVLSLSTNWINNSAYKIMQPDLSVRPGMQVQQHCSEYFTWFQWRLGFNTKLLVSVFSVSIGTARHHYISDLLHPYCPCRTLRSLDSSLLTVPRFSLETFGKRFLSVFGPTV